MNQQNQGKKKEEKMEIEKPIEQEKPFKVLFPVPPQPNESYSRSFYSFMLTGKNGVDFENLLTKDEQTKVIQLSIQEQ